MNNKRKTTTAFSSAVPSSFLSLQIPAYNRAHAPQYIGAWTIQSVNCPSSSPKWIGIPLPFCHKLVVKPSTPNAIWSVCFKPRISSLHDLGYWVNAIHQRSPNPRNSSVIIELWAQTCRFRPRLNTSQNICTNPPNLQITTNQQLQPCIGHSKVLEATWEVVIISPWDHALGIWGESQ